MSSGHSDTKRELLHKHRQEADEQATSGPLRVERALAELVEHLQRTLAELRAAEEQLRQDKEELVAARRRVETERQHYAELFNAAPDGYLLTDAHGVIREANRAAASLLNTSQSALIGQQFLSYISENERHTLEPLLRQDLRTGLAHHWEVRVLPSEQAPFDAAITIAAVGDDTGEVRDLRWLVRNISARKQAERRLGAQLATTRILAESPTLAEATQKILQAVCESLEWDLGELWRVDWQAQVLRCVDMWYTPSLAGTDFVAATRQLTFPPEVGLPGRVWASGEPAWMPNLVEDANFLRTALARRAGLRAAFAFPIRVGARVLGVMAFFSREIRQIDEELLRIFASVGSQIGQFIERKEAEESLRRHTEFAESLLETAPAIVLVLDREGRIVRFNAYMEEISGYRLQEVQGRDWVTTFLPAYEQSSTRELFAKALRGAPTRGARIPILTKVGQEREIEWFDKVLTDAGGNTIGLLAIGQDISERMRAEAWLRSLIDTTQDAVVSIDRQARIVLFNPAAERMFGYSASEVRGQKVSLLMPDPFAREHDDYIARYERTGERRAIGRIRTVAARRKSGEVFPIELSVAEVQSDADVRYGAFIRDISEKIKLQEQLLERERLAAIGTTAAKFAHEIGNPLNSMYMAAQRLERRLTKQRQLLDDNTIIPLVHSLTGEIRRLTVLLDEFRSLARRQQVSARPIRLDLLVHDVLTVLAPEYSAQAIEIKPEVSPEIATVEADGQRLRQVLLNLCKNAAEAMPEGGTLTVRAYNSGDRVTLEVSDTGVGVPPDMDIFEPFHTTKAQGTGLGLTIARQIVVAHHGTLTYRSIPGQGTTFTVVLPLAQPSGSPAGNAPPQ